MTQTKIGKRIVLVNDDMATVLSSLPDQSVHLIWTDPPYGHNNNDGDFIAKHEEAMSGRGKANDARPIFNDDLASATRLFNVLRREAARVLVPGGTLCVCCGGGGGPKDIQFARWSLKLQRTKGLQFKHAVVWDKGPIGMGWHYRRSHEQILVASKLGEKPLWFDTSRRIENVIRPGDHGVRKIIPAAGQHPTEKPVELSALFIKLHTAPGHLVVDPFMGSGSTGVAAVQAGRRFLGIELDPVWFKAATTRIKRCVETHGIDQGTAPPQATKKLRSLWKEV